jgi:hypothetical protein
MESEEECTGVEGCGSLQPLQTLFEKMSQIKRELAKELGSVNGNSSSKQQASLTFMFGSGQTHMEGLKSRPVKRKPKSL